MALGFLIAGGSKILYYGGRQAVKSFGSRTALKATAKGAGNILRTTALPAAMFYSASQLGHWANTNVQQTEQISEDAAERLEYQEDYLDWEKEKWELQEEARQEEEEISLLQTGLIEAYSQKGRQFQAGMQMQSQSFESQIMAIKQNQLINDRNMYLANQAFQTFTGGRKTTKDDQYTIAYILSELINLQQLSNNQRIDQPNLDPEYEDFENFNDYYEYEED